MAGDVLKAAVDLQNRVLKLAGALHDISLLARDQHENAEVLLDEILTITERELAT